MCGAILRILRPGPRVALIMTKPDSAHTTTTTKGGWEGRRRQNWKPTGGRVTWAPSLGDHGAGLVSYYFFFFPSSSLSKECVYIYICVCVWCVVRLSLFSPLLLSRFASSSSSSLLFLLHCDYYIEGGMKEKERKKERKTEKTIFSSPSLNGLDGSDRIWGWMATYLQRQKRFSSLTNQNRFFASTLFFFLLFFSLRVFLSLADDESVLV